jgi:hypothetical protein
MNTELHIETHGSTFDIAKWVWRNLVPKSGAASSIQGELLRSIERLRWEAQENGNINWDEGFVLYLSFIAETLLKQDYLSSEDRTSIEGDLDRLRNFIPPDEISDDHALDHRLPYVNDDLYNRLVEHVANFCRHNPCVIPMQADTRQFR